MNPIPLLPALLLAGGIPRAPLTCTVTPRIIEAGAFYNGASVRVEGRAAAGSKLILTVTGLEREECFNRKARFGPIWLNASKLRISGMPSLFLRFSVGPISAILCPNEISRNRLDQESLMARMHIEPKLLDHRDDATIRNDYMALKRGEGAFSLADGGIVMQDSGDCTSYALDLHWPKRAPPAVYEVRVFEVVDGSIARQASVPLSVVRTGFPAWLADLAANRASSYGVAAVLIGALAGFGIDRLSTLLFGKKRSVAR